MAHTYHAVEFVRFGAPSRFKALCRQCGWVSRPHLTEDDAINDGDGHVVAMAGADG